MRLRPRTPDPFNVMGGVYMRLGEPSRAVEMFKQAVALSPKDTPAVFAANLAAAYFWIGDYKASIDWNLKALQTEPQFWRAHVTLARAYAMAGDDDKARAQAQAVRRLRPGYKVDVDALHAQAASAVPSHRALIEEKLIPASRKAGLTE